MKELWRLFQTSLLSIPSTDTLFNQYNDYDGKVDLKNAAKIRNENFRKYLNRFSKKPWVLMVGEAAGPWGARFSGVPFTGEKQLATKGFPFSGKRSSLENPSIKTRKSPPYTSNTAEAFWEIMKPYHPDFLVWDCVPFHPHQPNQILSIRNPSRKEIQRFSELLDQIIKILEPKTIIAIGRKAEFALKLLNHPACYVRHPSFGGVKDFRASVEKEFNRGGR